jgi:HMG (high mobility group) box
MTTVHKHRMLKWTWQKPPGAPKRPLSAYNYFFSEMRHNIKKETSDGTTGGFESLAKHISYLWKELPEQEKQKYDDMAKASKDEYELLKKDWSETVGYKEALHEKKEKKKLTRAKYRQRIKSKLLLEKAKSKQGFAANSETDFVDKIIRNSCQSDQHLVNPRDVTKLFIQPLPNVNAIGESDISQLTQSCQGSILGHDIHQSIDRHVPSDLNEDEISVSDLSDDRTIISIDAKLEDSLKSLNTSINDFAHDTTFLGYDTQLVQVSDQDSNCTGSCSPSQDDTSLIINRRPRTFLQPSASKIHPDISMIQRLNPSKQKKVSFNIPALDPNASMQGRVSNSRLCQKFGIERFMDISLGSEFINPYDDVFNISNRKFRHQSNRNIYDVSTAMDSCNTDDLTSLYNGQFDCLFPLEPRIDDRLACMSETNVQSFFKTDCTISSTSTGNCVSPTTVGTNTNVHDPFNFMDQTSDIDSNCHDQSTTDFIWNRYFPDDTKKHRFASH